MARRRAVGRSKKARYGEGRDSDTVDRLSDLPDVVLHHILSCVPITDAVRTSLLSKRWQHLWPFIPKLAFYQWQFRKRSNFMNLVDRALLLRDSFSVEEFNLSCDAKSNKVTIRINSWIARVVRLKVQELHLNIFPGRGRVVFPSCLFRCQTLMRLRIFFSEPHDLIMPSSVCLPSLRDLILGRAQFVDYGSVQNLLLSCPALESLSIDECYWMGLNGKTISAPNLHRLTIRDFQWQHPGSCKVVINGPNVKFFHYVSGPYYKYCLVGSSSLSVARLSLSPLTYSDWDLTLHLVGISDQFQGLLMHNVRSLTLPAKIFRSTIGEDVFQDWPIFSNMTKLRLERHVFLGSKALATLLTKSPRLRTLEIYLDSFDKLDAEASQVLEPVPPCFQSQLKKIIVRCPRPAEVNLDWIRLLLRKATVLEDMVFYHEKIEEGDKSLKHLKKLRKRSKDCKISLLERKRVED